LSTGLCRRNKRYIIISKFIEGEQYMAFTSQHIGNNLSVVVEFPCPVCGKGTAKGTFKKSCMDKNGYADISCGCTCGECFDGTAILHQAGLDVDITINDNRVKDSDLKIYGF
jgi:hypothetical protein